MFISRMKIFITEIFRVYDPQDYSLTLYCIL